MCVCKCVCVCAFLIGCTRSTPTETLPSPVQIQPIPRLCPLSGHLLCQYITLCNGQLHRKVPIVYIALHLIQDQLAYSSDSGWIRKTAMRERVRERQRDRERNKKDVGILRKLSKKGVVTPSTTTTTRPHSVTSELGYFLPVTSSHSRVWWGRSEWVPVPRTDQSYWKMCWGCCLHTAGTLPSQPQFTLSMQNVPLSYTQMLCKCAR